MITFIETIKKVIQDTLVVPGQLLYSTDTDETFIDTDEGTRIKLYNVIYLNNEADKESVHGIENRIYIVKETSQIYRYEGAWFKVKDSNHLLCTSFHNDEYIPTTLTKKGKKIAPRTTATAVYDEWGEAISVEIDSANMLTLCKTKAVYVEATENGQKLFRIPFPIENYDFTKNYMTVVINNRIVPIDKYIIKDHEYLILERDQPGVNSGQLVLFIFYYNVYIDINAGLIIQNNNLADRIITEDKLDNGCVSTRTIADKAITEPKLDDESVSNRTLRDKVISNEKLADDSVDARTIALNSISTGHLNSSNLEINANNITETDDRKFISQTQINNWNDNIADTEQLKLRPQLYVSDTAPSAENVKEKDIWADTTDFVFKVRKDDSWIPMGAVYK